MLIKYKFRNLNTQMSLWFIYLNYIFIPLGFFKSPQPKSKLFIPHLDFTSGGLGYDSDWDLMDSGLPVLHALTVLSAATQTHCTDPVRPNAALLITMDGGGVYWCMTDNTLHCLQ